MMRARMPRTRLVCKRRAIAAHSGCRRRAARIESADASPRSLRLSDRRRAIAARLGGRRRVVAVGITAGDVDDGVLVSTAWWSRLIV